MESQNQVGITCNQRRTHMANETTQDITESPEFQELMARYPEMLTEFIRQQEIDLRTFCKKQLDYGPSNIAVGTALATTDDIRLSLTGIWFRVNDKIQRLKNLIVLGKAAQNESAYDSLMDVSVYGIIARVVSEGKWGK